MSERVRAPRWLAESAARFAESGAEPVVPKLAATVILLRPTANGFEVYAQQRASTMAFAANMYAFPGGSVDPSDSDAYIDWVGPSPEAWATRMDLPIGSAQAVVCAAVRELFEEAGVLLAGDGTDRIIADVAAPEFEAARADLVARRHSLTEWFGRTGLGLRADLLLPWARWLTPKFEPRRYDTFFFLARLPAGQEPRNVGGEADHTMWVSPAEALTLPMLPPTLHTLGVLAQYPDIDALVAAAADRDISTPVHPVMEDGPDGPHLRLS